MSFFVSDFHLHLLFVEVAAFHLLREDAALLGELGALRLVRARELEAEVTHEALGPKLLQGALLVVLRQRNRNHAGEEGRQEGENSEAWGAHADLIRTVRGSPPVSDDVLKTAEDVVLKLEETISSLRACEPKWLLNPNIYIYIYKYIYIYIYI